MDPTLPRSLLGGLVLFGLLSVVDVVITFVPVSLGETGPPFAAVVLGLVLGIVSLGLLAIVVLRRSTAALRWLTGCRVLSALTGLPAFFVGGVPSWVVVLVAIFLVLTLLGCVLVAPGLRRVPTKAV
ncbi:MAG: hypothetical protein QOE32_370 [Pseudonocardiales bacterium]|jgi:hypothetical protein|nr:hypothetical protein [Pseudonocardiales bacterium]